MNFLIYLRNLKVYFKRPKISIIIPFQSKEPHRVKSFNWTLRYWLSHLPQAEIIIGKSHQTPFCKTEAFNNAIKQSRGEVLVLIDSDAYLDYKVVLKCVKRILEDPKDKLWFVPYRNLYRLNEEATRHILKSNPTNPLQIPYPPKESWIVGEKTGSKYGHRYGAMAIIIPREAYDTLGCFDERFKGWGGEDVSILRALDTLYGKHKTTKNPIYHLWHPTIGTNYKNRAWEGQKYFNYNGNLALRYHRATRNFSLMRNLVNEGVVYKFGELMSRREFIETLLKILRNEN